MSALCKTHDFPAKYCCFFCKVAIAQCVFCIRDDHKECPDSYILRMAQLREIPLDAAEAYDFEEFQEEQTKYLKSSKAHLNSTMNELKERVNQMVNFVEFVDEDFCSDNVVSQIKKHYQIKADKKTEKILLTPNFDTNQIEPKKLIRTFRGKLASQNEQFLKDLSRVPFQVLDQPLCVESFVKPECLVITKRATVAQKNDILRQEPQKETFDTQSEPKELKNSPKVATAAENKQLSVSHANDAIAIQLSNFSSSGMCFYSIPIKNAFFTVTVEGEFNHTIETLEIGLLKSQITENANFQKFITGSIPKSYQGPAISSQKIIEMTDQSQTKTPTQEKLFEPNSPFHIRVSDKSIMRVFTSDRKKTFQKELSPQHQYYLYIKLSSAPVTILLS